MRIIVGMSTKYYVRFAWLLLALAAPVQAAVSECILLQASPLAGFQYHAGKKVWDELHEGDAVELVREADNAYVPHAVRVLWQGTMLGYVPRRDNEAVPPTGSRLAA